MKKNTVQFLPEAIFDLPSIVVACVCLCVRSFVHASVCQPWACTRDNLWPIQVKITKFGPDVQNTLLRSLLFMGWLTLTLIQC